MSPLLVYYTTNSLTTKRLVDKLGFETLRIPNGATRESLVPLEDFILVTPTYGGGKPVGAVPRPVQSFLNNPQNAKHLKAVIACGNRDYGPGFCLSGSIIAKRFQIPHIASIELFGTPEETAKLRNGVIEFWTRLKTPTQI